VDFLFKQLLIVEFKASPCPKLRKRFQNLLSLFRPGKFRLVIIIKLILLELFIKLILIDFICFYCQINFIRCNIDLIYRIISFRY